MKKLLRKEFHLEDGTKVFFYNLNFDKIIKSKLQLIREGGEKKSKQDLLLDIQEVTGVSASSMNHWLLGHNGPGDIESIRLVAEALDVDIMNILDESPDADFNDRKDNMMSNNVDNYRTNEENEKVLVRNIYALIVDYVERFRNSIGFECADEREGVVYSEEEAIEAYQMIVIQIRKAMLDIPYETYDKLLKFTEGYLDCMTVSRLHFR